jgi:hypothetical protein
VIASPYLCCNEGVCPQHVQQYRENQRWAESDLIERRGAGHTNLVVHIFGEMI